jgi:4-carboxymuconolactone decarboxylase
MTARQQEVVDQLIERRGGTGGPYDSLLRSPDLALGTLSLGDYLRFGSTLPRDLSEIAILTAVSHWRAAFAQHEHGRMARSAGVDEQAVESLIRGEPPAGLSPEQAAVHSFVRQILDEGAVDDETYARVAAVVDESGTVDLIATVGFYCMVAFLLNVDRVPPRVSHGAS